MRVGDWRRNVFADYRLHRRSNCILWGDGAGAVILASLNEEQGIISTHLHADGNYEKMLHVPRKHDGTPDTVHMEGNAVFKMAVNTLDQIVDETLTANNMQKTDIDWMVPHQANIRILQATAKKLDMGMDKVVVTVDKHGNTSAASIPLALMWLCVMAALNAAIDTDGSLWWRLYLGLSPD